MTRTLLLGPVLAAALAAAGCPRAAARWCKFTETIDANLATLPTLDAALFPGTAAYLKTEEEAGAQPTGAGLKAFLKKQIESDKADIVGGGTGRQAYEAKAIVSAGTGEDVASEDDPVCVVVLGASAVGKSHLTRTNIGSVLEANGITGRRDFISIDGGILREEGVFPTWDEIKRLAKEMDCTGFSDAYESKVDGKEQGIAKNAMSKGKTELQKVYLKAKRSVIVPTTASDIEKEKTAIAGFAEKNYRVLFLAVNADQANACAMGTVRAADEGKKYSGSSWLKSTRNAAALINAAHSDDAPFGAFAKTATHIIFDNNNYDRLRQNGGVLRKSLYPGGLQVSAGATVTFTCTPDEATFKDHVIKATGLCQDASKGIACDYSTSPPPGAPDAVPLLRENAALRGAETGYKAGAAKP